MVAEKAGEVVGHIFFSPVSFETPNPPRACQLSPLAVLPELQRKGIGTALVEAGLTACAEIGWSAAFLLGDPRYYSKLGFEMAATKSLVHSGTDGEYLQYREIEDGALANVSGEVRFHPIFDAFE
jgi:putative acetyltransferase